MRRLTLLLLLACARIGFAAPELLIAQLKDVKNTKPDTILPAIAEIAKEFDQEGRVVPISWSKSDALLSTLIAEGKVKFSEYPTEKQVLEAASKNRIGYVLVFATLKEDNLLKASGRLFHNGRLEWKDDYNSTLKVDNAPDWRGQAESLARTWVIKLGEGPLKGLAARPKIDKPPVTPGVLTPGGSDPEGPPTPKPQPLTQDTIERAQKMITEKRVAEAIVSLRDAVDSAPRDPAARRALVEALVYAGLFDMAADEALRAAQIIPESSEMYLIAARAYARLGRPDQAQEALNNALARDGQSHMSYIIRGEVLLLKNRPDEALEQFNEALKTKNSYDARLGRAVANAFLGKDADCAEDYALIPPVGEALMSESYQRVILLTNQRVEGLVTRMREVMQDGLAKGKSTELLNRSLAIDSEAKGLDKLIGLMKPPTRHLMSHAKRELAQKLLLQATSDCVTFAQQVTEDASTEVAISLGEAIRRYTTARAEFDQERREMK